MWQKKWLAAENFIFPTAKSRELCKQDYPKYLWSPYEQEKIFVPSHFRQNFLSTNVGHNFDQCGKTSPNHQFFNQLFLLLPSGKSISSTIMPSKFSKVQFFNKALLITYPWHQKMKPQILQCTNFKCCKIYIFKMKRKA